MKCSCGCEPKVIAYKKLPTYNPQFSKGKPLHSRGTAYKSKKPKNQNYGEYDVPDDVRAGSSDKYPTSVLRFTKPHPSAALHRTEKPVDLLEYLIKTYTNEGDIVLDNCMGCGGVGVACVTTNRQFIGIELDEQYFLTAERRITAAERGRG